MAAPVCQFVDRVGTGAVQRLNLNDGKKLTLMAGPDQRPGPDFSPPALKRAVVNTLMVEGASIPASAYDNRIIRLPLRVKACDEEEMAEILESLHRELDRGNNILKWHPTYNSRPVYFRTFRSPDYRLDQTMEGRGEMKVTLAIVAEPFAYGDYIEQTGTIYNDPEAVANGIHFEIDAIEGDVPTPLYLHFLGSTTQKIVLAARRHGTPTLYWRQCEAMTQGTDTTTQPNDATMSGAGQNFSRTTFVAPADAIRLTWVIAPAAGSSVEYRGVYRAFIRVRRSDNTSDIEARIDIALGEVEVDWVTIPQNLLHQMVDLGLFRLPLGSDPVYDGYRNVMLAARSETIRVRARRTAGAGTIDWDYMVLVPADEELAIAGFDAGGVARVFDGPNDMAHDGDLAGLAVGGVFTPLVGSIPLVTPDQTNLYVVLYGLDVYNGLTDTLVYTARYWPRHLYIR